MYTKQFEIRWSDVDANRHLANSAYTNFMSHTRMGFFIEKGLTMDVLVKHNSGLVVFYEHMYYFKEAFLGQLISVSIEVSGLSVDGMFFKFDHNFYSKNGKNIAHCEMLGAWINLKTRKLMSLNEELLQIANTFPRSKNFKILMKEDTCTIGKTPIDLVL